MMIKKPTQVPVQKILSTLQEMYPDAHCELNYRNPFELLIATILSAQTTDRQVNIITRDLFAEHPTPEAFLRLTEQELAAKIRGIGLYRNKSKNILKTCQLLVSKFGGKVPEKRVELESLPGVGRKTANVVLSNAFSIPALAVDTHVQRVSNRLALADSKNPLETEKQLTEKIPKDQWIDTHHRLIWHGRRLCHARKPKCDQCKLYAFCWYGKNQNRGNRIS